MIDSNLCNVHINIDKEGSGLCEMTTNSIEGAIELDSKKPAKIRPRQSTHVLYLPYAMMDTVICAEEKEENDFVEWGVMKVEDRKYKRMKEPLFIGDTVKYFHPLFVYGCEDGLQNGILQSFDWVNKKVTLNTMCTQGKGFRLRRINGYNEHLNKRIDMDGLTRSVEEFDWKVLPAHAPKCNIKQSHEIFTEIIEENKRAMKRKLEEENNPYAGFIDGDKNMKKR